MASSFLVLLSFLSLCATALNVTIENDTGDARTGTLPIYMPLPRWKNSTFLPETRDTNPDNILAPITVTTTRDNSQQGLAWMTLLFHGK